MVLTFKCFFTRIGIQLVKQNKEERFIDVGDEFLSQASIFGSKNIPDVLKRQRIRVSRITLLIY